MEAMRQRLQRYSLPRLAWRWAWVGIKLAFSAIRASAALRRQERFSTGRMRERNAERVDRLRHPERYRGRP
jgi:hypothetical protein